MVHVTTQFTQIQQGVRSDEPWDNFVFEASAPAGVPSSCSRSIEQFIKTTYQSLLNRQPLANELFPAENALAAAQAQGTSQFLAAAQNFANDLFHTSEYVNLGTTDQAFVYDLFAVYENNDSPGLALVQYHVTRVQHLGRDHVQGTFAASVDFENVLGAMCVASTYDADLDGLPDLFENQVANAFTPYYRVSVGETDSFSTFANNSTQQIVVPPLLGQTPFSYFRVQPLGFASSQGTLFSVLRIDYLSLWNHDSGLVSGGLCAYSLFGLDDIIASLSDHDLDNERSAVLVAAPVQGYNYNTNASNYYSYDYYTAAHENTITDQSAYTSPPSPWQAGTHVQLGLTRSKHATYTANVDGLPLVPYPIIAGTFATLDFLYVSQQIDWPTYVIYTALTYNVFYSCITERFTNPQVGEFSSRRVNVGEPNLPINGAGFIQTTELYNKLTTPLWILQ